MENSTSEAGEVKPRSILLVDDAPKNLRLLSEILTQQGYRVSSAVSGPLALNFLKINIPDIILLDIKMPDMDGFEVCKRIKGNPDTKPQIRPYPAS